MDDSAQEPSTDIRGGSQPNPNHFNKDGRKNHRSREYEPPKSGKGSRLTTKMSLFVDEYLIDFNATQAVLRAGYKTEFANRVGTKLLNHPLIAAEIKKKTAKRREKMELSAEYVINKLINIIEETDKDNPQAALRGLELLGKHLGMYRDRQEISGPDGKAIEYQQRVEEDVNDFTRKLSRLADTAGKGEVVSFPNAGSKSSA